MTVDDDTSPKAPVAAPVTPAGRVRTAAERGSVPLTGSPVVLVQGMLARVMVRPYMARRAGDLAWD